MLTGFWPIAALLGEFFLKLALIVHILLRRRRRDASTLAWIVIILAVPLLGIVGYVLFGETRLGRRRIRRHAEIIGRLERVRVPVDKERTKRSRPKIPPAYGPIATLAESVGQAPPIGGNHAQLIGDTDLFIETLVLDIDGARSSCHLLFYIFLDDDAGRRVTDALVRAAGRGVACRVLVDAVGSRGFARSAMRDELERTGVRVVEALPASLLRLPLARIDLRNHRKIVVIDGAIGYLGSQNIADAAFAPKPKFAPWVDASVRVHGPVTHQLQTLFAEDWFLDTEESLETLLAESPAARKDGISMQVTGTGPNSRNEAMRHLILTAVHAAREELILTTPYFVPDEATASALVTAASRGVDTILILPARNDSPLVAAASRSFYAGLLDAGVKIFEYEKGLLHSKTLTLDRELALVSSANLDRRSFELNFEVSVVVYDTDFASQLRFLQTSYLSDSRPVDAVEWTRRRWPLRLWENAAGTLSPLL